MSTGEATLTLIFDTFEQRGSEQYGEDVSQLQHALQCAQLAREHGCANSLVAAALLHDIGRLVEPEGNAEELRGIDARHETIGANVLRGAFPLAVTEPIRLHVAAKRYLCATDAEYAARLSHASVLSLNVQGGAMSPEEVVRFRQEPFFAAAIQLRRFDDWGKRVGCEVASLEVYRDLLRSLCAAQGR